MSEPLVSTYFVNVYVTCNKVVSWEKNYTKKLLDSIPLTGFSPVEELGLGMSAREVLGKQPIYMLIELDGP